MIIPNASIAFITFSQEQHFDDDGYPIKWDPDVESKDLVPCQVLNVEHDATAVSASTETAFELAKWEVLVEERHFKRAHTVYIEFDYGTHRRDIEAEVIENEYLRAVGQWRIRCR